MKEIYLDTAATKKPLREVTDAIMPYLTYKWYNPSSAYSPAIKVKKDIESVRNNVANLINAESNEIFFTSGACESNNWALRGFIDANTDGIIVTTKIEHQSIIDCVKNINGNKCYYCDVDSDGIVLLDSLKSVLKNIANNNNGSNILVSIIAANNEIGTIQNIREISKIVHDYNGIFHTDATQYLPYLPINVKEMGIDLLSASSQKFGGLKGTGFLYKKNGINIKPLIYGTQENGQRGGTENVVGIIALGEAIKHIDYVNMSRLAYVRDYFIDKLENIGCKINGSRTNRLPNNINIVLPNNINAESMLISLDMSNIYISSGSACNSQLIEPSHVLQNIGKEDVALNTIRITIPDDITFKDINDVIYKIVKIAEIDDYYI